MGMDHAGEIERLTRCARPSAGIITMIGVSHLENLGTRENILKAKMEICTGLPDGAPLVLNADNDLLPTADVPTRLKAVWSMTRWLPTPLPPAWGWMRPAVQRPLPHTRRLVCASIL